MTDSCRWPRAESIGKYFEEERERERERVESLNIFRSIIWSASQQGQIDWNNAWLNDEIDLVGR